MCIQTNLLLHLPLNSISFYAFVFGATLLQYNLHYLVKKTAVINSERLKWSQNNNTVHKILIATALILILISLFSFQLQHFIFLGILGIITLLYSLPILPFKGKRRIKDFGFLKIFTLVLMWTIVTAWFPVQQYISWSFSFILIFVRRFIFIFILCLMFDIRDTNIDAVENIKTIPVKIGIAKSYLLAYILLFIFILLSIIELIKNENIIEFNAMLLSAFATIIIIKISKKNAGDLIYLACIDGMMFLQAMLVIIGSF